MYICTEKHLKHQFYSMKEDNNNKALSLKNLTKSTVWDVQENDIFRMLLTSSLKKM